VPAAPQTAPGNGFPNAVRIPQTSPVGPTYPVHSPPAPTVGSRFPANSPPLPIVPARYPNSARLTAEAVIRGASFPNRSSPGMALPTPTGQFPDHPTAQLPAPPAQFPDRFDPGMTLPTPVSHFRHYNKPGEPGSGGFDPAPAPNRRFPTRHIDPLTRIPRWRQRLRIASFKGIEFYVEQQGRTSGTRTVLHQYPKRSVPYAESMGREALHYAVTGYLIQSPNWPTGASYYEMLSDYSDQRDSLEAALMDPVPGELRDPHTPYLGVGYAPLLFMCEKYTIVEQREKGGFCSIEMSFVEAGVAGMSIQMQDTAGVVANAANNASTAVAAQANAQLGAVNQPGAALAFEE
jgi:hypothetical protein